MYDTLLQAIGNTPLVELSSIPGKKNAERNNVFLAKLEGNNPAGSVKDRAAVSMILGAQNKGLVKKNSLLIEATSGNTGIALAMASRILGYSMRLIMPENLSIERRQVMRAFGAELILVSQNEGMEGARDFALEMEKNGEGKVLNQFSNDDNWLAHYNYTAEEILRSTAGNVTHFVSAMGTTGTITGVSKRLKEFSETIQNNGDKIITLTDGSIITLKNTASALPPNVPPTSISLDKSVVVSKTSCFRRAVTAFAILRLALSSPKK